MLKMRQSSISPNLNVEYKKKYARHLRIGRLRDISNSEAYLLTEDDKALFSLRDEISITLELGQRKRTLQASVIANDTQGVKVKFHFYNNREYQIIDDLIYFIEKSKRRKT